MHSWYGSSVHELFLFGGFTRQLGQVTVKHTVLKRHVPECVEVGFQMRGVPGVVVGVESSVTEGRAHPKQMHEVGGLCFEGKHAADHEKKKDAQTEQHGTADVLCLFTISRQFVGDQQSFFRSHFGSERGWQCVGGGGGRGGGGGGGFGTVDHGSDIGVVHLCCV